MKCTKRDEELFRLICRHNLLSTKQIHQHIFPTLKLTTVMRRLRKLERGGLLKRLGRLYSGMSVWGNSSQANDRTTGFFSSSRTNLHTLEHDVTVAEIHLLFEQLTEITDWFDMRHIRADSICAPFKEYGHYLFGSKKGDAELIPDSLFTAWRGGKRSSFALEVELSMKAFSRYRDLIDVYAERDEPKVVLFVVRNQSILNAVFRAAERYARMRERVHAVFLDALLLQREQAVVMRPGGDSVLIRDLFDPKPAVPRSGAVDVHRVDKKAATALSAQKAEELLEW